MKKKIVSFLIVLSAAVTSMGCIAYASDIEETVSENVITIDDKEYVLIDEQDDLEDEDIDICVPYHGDMQQHIPETDSLAGTWYASWGTEAMLKEADAEAKRVVKELITDDMCDIQRIFVLAKYMNENVEYGIPSGSKYRGQTAYDALIMKKSVCAGNASAFSMLLYYSGIDNNFIISNKRNHAWLQVRLNGKWYTVDAQNAVANKDFFICEQNDNYYFPSDIETYESEFKKKYYYDGKVHSCKDSTFMNLDFTTLRPIGGGYYTYALDWNTFYRSMLSKGIDVESYASRGFELSGLKESYKWHPDMEIPSFKVIIGDKTLIEGVDYEITSVRDTGNVGTASISIVGLGKYSRYKTTTTYEITPVELKDVYLAVNTFCVPVSDKPIEHELIFKKYNYTLLEGADYTITCLEGKYNQPGNVSIVLAGKGNFKGSINLQYIARKINHQSVTLIKGGVLKANGLPYLSAEAKKIVSADKKGNIKGKKVGSTELTVNKNDFTADAFSIRVIDAPKFKSQKMSIGQTFSLAVDERLGKMDYSVSKPAVTIDEKGIVTAVSAGSSTVTFNLQGKKYKVKFTVK